MKVIRRFWIPIVILISIVLISLRFNEVKNAAILAKAADKKLLLLALAVQTAVLLCQAGIMVSSLTLVGNRTSFPKALSIVLSMEFITIAVPSAGASGVGYVASAHGSGMIDGEPGRSLIAGLIYFMNGYLATGVVVLLTLNTLAPARRAFEAVCCSLAAAAVLMLTAFGLGLLRRRRDLPAGFIHGATGAVNSILSVFRRKTRLDEGRLLGILDRIGSLRDIIVRNRRHSAIGFLYALGVDAASVGVLWFSALSVGLRLAAGPLLAVYALGITLAIFSITPSGVGVMEPAMFAALSKFGAPSEKAMVAIAVYRIVGFWIPFLAGLLTTAASGRRRASGA